MQSKSDLRLYARFEYVECAMVYEEGNTEPYRAMLIDIGLGGVQLKSKDKLPVSIPLEMNLGQDDKAPLVAKGHIRYCYKDGEEDFYVSGFKFTPESHEERVQIAEYVHAVFQRQWQSLAG
jgi:c-di-GMP-binding flagellar brake protein YcgR